MLNKITHKLDGRLWEWTINLGLLGLAIEVVIWPRTMTVGAFRGVSDFMAPEIIGAFALAVGVCGIVALWFNGGSFVVGPVVRSICAVLRALLWSQFAFALFALRTSQDAPSPGLPFWIAFTFAELYVAYRAMIDVRRNL